MAVTWTGPTPDAVALRSTDAAGRWGAWLPLDSNAGERDGAPARAAGGGTDPVWVGDRRQVEVRATRAGVPVTQGLAVQRIDPGTSGNDAAIGARARERDSAARSGAPAAPAYVTRAQWGADPKLMTWPPEYTATTRAVTIHHTSESNDYTPEQSAAIVRGIYAYHSRTNNWGDIGYNALVDKYGTIFEGRAGGMDRPVVAAHAGGFNRETFGIAMMGNLSGTAADPGRADLGGAPGRMEARRHVPRPVPEGHAHLRRGRDVEVRQGPDGDGRRPVRPPRRREHRVPGQRRATPRWTPSAPRPPSSSPPRAPTCVRRGRRIPSSASPTASSSRPRTAAAGSPTSSTGRSTGRPTTGAHEVSGSMLATWRARGAERSALGLPTGDEHAVDGGRVQDFEHGPLRVPG